jgi:sec-independent protein translocase protein TatB
VIDLGISKLALIGAVALVVIGPEKLPTVARTLGTLWGKAQRYIADVKAEVNRSMELDALRQVKETMEKAAHDVQHSMQTTAREVEHSLGETSDATQETAHSWTEADLHVPEYRHPGKNWRLKRSAVPHWYKARQGVKTRALSSAARVARYRPKVTPHV